MDENIEFWKIGDFAKLVGKHVNTVDNWFKMLEDEGYHYVNRVKNNEKIEKVYDQLDLQIARYIVKKREQKWNLNGIFDTLSHHFELRPFPVEPKEATSDLQAIDLENLKQTLISDLKKELRNEMTNIFQQEIHKLEKKIVEQQKCIEESSISKKEIENIFKKEIQKLEQKFAEQQEYIENKLEQRDRTLVDYMRQTLDQQKFLTTTTEKEKKRKWWRFW